LTLLASAFTAAAAGAFMLGAGQRAPSWEYVVVTNTVEGDTLLRFANGEISDPETLAEFLRLDKGFDRALLGPLGTVEIMTSRTWELVGFEIAHDSGRNRNDRVYLLRRPK
jgi:hypothetical protein